MRPIRKTGSSLSKRRFPITVTCMKTATLRTLVVLFSVPAVAAVAVLAQAPQTANTTADHQEMLAKLNITTPLRPGPAGRLNADGTAPANYANYDETKATAKSPAPPLLKMNDGRAITTAAQWDQHRKELLEIFDREFYGRLPDAARTIKVTWEVTATTEGMSGAIPTITRTLVGHVDPTYYPAITVNIGASVTTPANAAGKVPVIIQWGGAPPGGGRLALPGAGAARGAGPVPAAGAAPGAQAPAVPGAQAPAIAGGAARGAGPAPSANNPPFPNGTTTWQQAAISMGWGYGSLNPGSIQADSGANNQLRQGIIGLINKGESRKVDDWGALRAWAWGAGKLIDFFESDTMVDAKQIAFEGHSRYGKATIVTLVYEPRALTGFVSSSGEGGAKMWRHLVGEQVESLAAPSEYHWMTPNFIKYAGPLTVDDLPADAHQFVALVAPRPVFVSGGEYLEFNGAKPGTRWSNESWQDTPGTFMATAGASPVWKLLGKTPLSNKSLGLVFDNVPDAMAVKSRMPAPLTPLIDGDIAFRQHDQGHTDAPNWSTFIQFASRYFKSPGFKR
jgi:hypothetical protein